jgi:two-component system cell cycle response regulator
MARILIIEDNPANLELMAYLLRATGHEVLEACDGEEGLELVRRITIDLVVCDVHMPRLDGYAVVDRLKAIPAWRRIPVLAVTAMAMVGDRERVLGAGFDGYFSKPIEPESFAREVALFLPAPDFSREPMETAPGEPAPAAVSQPQAAPKPANGHTVVVIDDVAANLSLAQGALEPAGYAVFVASSAEEGLRSVRNHSPDLIISDIHMPKTDGFALLTAVKADPTLSSIPFMLLTTTHFKESEEALAQSLGADTFVIRPI